MLHVNKVTFTNYTLTRGIDFFSAVSNRPHRVPITPPRPPTFTFESQCMLFVPSLRCIVSTPPHPVRSPDLTVGTHFICIHCTALSTVRPSVQLRIAATIRKPTLPPPGDYKWRIRWGPFLMFAPKPLEPHPCN
jgi:hypothetical protein